MYNGRQKVTRKDVAREAGVSETIVSYVLNKNRYVKEEKRQRVLEAVEKLQYQPNNIARALHGKGSRQILFIAEELSSGYFSELVSQMSRDVYKQGYMISLCESRGEEGFVSQILSRQFDGLFVSASGVTDRELKLLAKSGVPMVVFLNREIECDLQNTVLVDTGLYEGSRECVKHLVKNGCRNFGYLDKTGRPCDRDIHLKGFLDQIKESGLVFEPEQKISGCKDTEELEERLQAILEKNPELVSRVQHFRSDNFRLQNEERGNLLQDAEQLARESAELRRNPEVNAYLDAELALCRMMQQICKTLTDGIEIKVPEI